MQSLDVKTATLAGGIGGLAYIVAQEVDNRLLGRRLDDLHMLGRLVTREPRRARSAGLPIHLANAVALGGMYAAIEGRLSGPAWLKGAAFAVAENTALYPLVLLEQHHPAIRNGEIVRYGSVASFIHSIPRHIVYGAVTGALYERWRRR